MSMDSKELVRGLAAAKTLAHMVIVGHENEQQGTWPENRQQHKCKSCYEAAIVLRAALAKLEREVGG